MQSQITPQEALHALETAHRRRLGVIQEIGLPRGYWFGLAAGWIGLGVISDLQHTWLTAAATLAFGAAHSAVSRRILSGRRRTSQLSVSSELSGWPTARLMIASLLALVLVTIGAGFAVSADGADHPATIAGVLAAVIVVLGGPQLMVLARRRAARAEQR
jgi:hypothetical protein